jgi:NADH-quinone oxidoreductase subunit E
VQSTRGASITSILDTEKVLAGFNDGKSEEANAIDDAMLAGLKVAKSRGMRAPKGEGF